MTGAAALLLLVTLSRLAELAVSARNTAALKARGAVEASPGHYPLIVALHAGWLAALWAFGARSDLVWGWAALFLGVQGARLWVLATLGRRWTTRILVLPGEPLVRTGPYRYLSHPNYAVVAAEIAILPLALGLVWVAVVFSALNAAVLAVRIAAENAALRGAAALAPRA